MSSSHGSRLRLTRRGVVVVTLIVLALPLAGWMALDDDDEPTLPGLQEGLPQKAPTRTRSSGEIPIKRVVILIKENRSFDNTSAVTPKPMEQ